MVEPRVRRDQGHGEPVDAVAMQDWEADLPNRFGAGLLFWCWYLPAEVIRGTRPTRDASRSDSQALCADVSAADRMAVPPGRVKGPVRFG
jgi:hypothetical protein